ncbi:NADH-cytochrome b5 reductase-like protein [Hondaea fermentalgiana]|uniref:NADH-cytochrome b5 reductase-like protein n=1 Tax=Hondaea fermentalgiana TaxID=2315210 RepID=A0A2R5GQP9_9STRA|nr:NADH-cytochrome b5 reductase-like protein [Hondaea fermentalgiana]|eukprot:GBG30681.1 NADH-cytochrome b5 reductase-like protein [Hondaea fermentalgiana]
MLARRAALAAAAATAAAATAALATTAATAAHAHAEPEAEDPTRVSEDPRSSNANAAQKVAEAAALETFEKLEVLRNKPLGANARIIRFKLPDRQQSFAYSFGDIINVRALSFDVDESYAFGKRLSRAYIPLHPLDRKGHMDIIVKTYPYPDGDTGRFLATRRQGDLVEVSAAPQPRLHAHIDLAACSTVAVLSAGSGLTAGIQLARAVLEPAPSPAAPSAPTGNEDPSDADDHVTAHQPRIKLISSDKTPDDMFYARELQQLAEKHPGQLTVFRTLTRDVPRDWTQGVGRVSADMLADQLGAVLLDPHAKVVVCGPPDFVHSLTGRRSSDNDAQLPHQNIAGILGDLGCTDPARVIIL